MSQAKRLKRVLGIDIDTCRRCGGPLSIVTSIERPEFIAKLLVHLECAAPEQYRRERPLGARAPPDKPAG